MMILIQRVRTAFARKAAAAVAVLFIVAAFSGCQRIKDTYGIDAAGSGAGAASVMEAPVFAVNTMAASQGGISDYLALAGDIVAGSAVDAYSEAAGKVSRIMVSVGSTVSRGAPIAEVDPSRPGMQYEVNVVKAPVAGTIVSLPAQVGMTVSQAVPLARIAGGSGLEIRLYVAERFISRIALRQTCEITLDAYPGEVFSGRITEVSPVVDPSSRTMEIHVGVDNSGSRLKAGMFAKVKIIIEQKSNVVKLPAAALIQRFGESYVFVTSPDPDTSGGFVAEKRTVVPGIVIDGVMEVAQGLSPNEDVIVRGHSYLNDGAKVNIVDRVPPLN
jgi:multidrug efflux pump subunit AcrA (membrane-fusion protein)